MAGPDGASSQDRPSSGNSRADRMRVRAAWMYYVEQMTQNDIATALGIGRVSVVRLLAEARNRSEVRISVAGDLAELTRTERALEARFSLESAVVVPAPGAGEDPSRVISAAIGDYLSQTVASGMTVGLGWGRTLYDSLPYIAAQPLDDLRVVSLLGGISQAHRFNPAEFAWRFAQIFNGDAFLLTAPAIVDSVATKTALIERCGLRSTLDMAGQLDLVVLSVGGIAASATTYRTGYIAEAERHSLQQAGAVGDLLFHFIDGTGALVDHPINGLIMSAEMAAIRQTPRRVIASGGPEKVDILRASLSYVKPTVLITDELTAHHLLEPAPGDASHG
ncbi:MULTISPECIES: sugar-binding transcriptional regulator [unclassified Aureimonas]|uniref:sugar-binding transcriptional regulator n=1 Tax=unclassified Aureimonas TaxID=2615206 RepID=UPI00070115F3|nr:MULTISPECIES: sugar-binding transcriptional regulator [unclassified Aureimonas]KQT52419.1 LacI family transcriptional regulator [Aureimonas sp. Leaf427]KQT74936.1 LacI family transcriptional regulator [Aureimonas sp. Leaf460]